jgi:signal transduction histidine kinase
MRMPEPRRMFQFIGLTVCAVVGIPVMVDTYFQLSSELARNPAFAFGWKRAAIFILMTMISMACLLGFAAVFLRTTQLGSRHTRTSKRAWLLLMLQVLLAFITSSDLLFIIAAEAAFVLPESSSLVWLAGQCAATAAFTIFAAATGHFSPSNGLTHTPDALVVPISILVNMAWVAFAFGIGYLADRAESGRQLLARSNAELMATQFVLADSSRMGERLRISRELHDAMGHRLAALNIQLELGSRLASGPSAEAVGEARMLAKLLLSEVREVVSELREQQEVNLKEAIGILARGLVRPRIHLSLDEGLDTLDPSRAHALFRCVQEAITNAIRHSDADNLWIELSYDTDRWRLSVRDDGHGAKEIQDRNGLRGIRERIEEMGGRLQIESQPGAGFHLYGTIPFMEGAV